MKGKKQKEPAGMNPSEIFAALAMLEKERGIPQTFMMEKIIQAITTAYKRDHDGVENVIVDVDEEHPISFDIMRKTVRKWKEVGAKDNYFFKYNLAIKEIHTGNFIEVLYKKYLHYYDYRKLDGMWSSL